MNRLNAMLLAAALVVLASVPARTQSQPRLEDLKREAMNEVASLNGFTQQMVDQIFSFSELGFQEPGPLSSCLAGSRRQSG